MLKNTIRGTLMSFLMSSMAFANTDFDHSISSDLLFQSLSQHNSGFASLEHRFLGDTIRLEWAPLTPNIDHHKRLHLPNGLSLSYGEIILYAGDLAGDESGAISSCKPEQQIACFEKHFKALAENTDPYKCQSPLNYIPKLQSYFVGFEEKIRQYEMTGGSLSQYHEEHSTEINIAMNRLTCGGSVLSDYIPFGKYLKLAALNFDHFVPDALSAYDAGHQNALDTALFAHNALQQNRPNEASRLLSLAYAKNAFSLHYLSDAFSSGHMRTPRRIIHNEVTLIAILKLLLANIMHDEDSRLGLEVITKNGLVFRAYGDNFLYTEEAQTQREVLTRIMQASTNAIYFAFLQGKKITFEEEKALLPIYSEIDNLQNHAALFKFDNGSLKKRCQNHNSKNFCWTTHWTALATLLDFQLYPTANLLEK